MNMSEKTNFYRKSDGEFEGNSLEPTKSMQRSVSGIFADFFLQKRLMRPKSQENDEYEREN